MFNKTLLSFILLSSLSFASLENREVSPTSIKNIKIVDIRTPSEWKERGIIKNAYTIMFFDEKGGYNVDKFILALNKVVKKDEKFAIICRTGHRTTTIADFLGNKLGYNLVNLKGGMKQLIEKYKYKTTPYKGN